MRFHFALFRHVEGGTPKRFLKALEKLKVSLHPTADACIEVPCLVDGSGVHPTHVGRLPVQCAAMNMTNINTQLLTIEAAVTGKREHIYHAAMLDPHTAAELSVDDIISMCDELFEAHEKSGFFVL